MGCLSPSPAPARLRGRVRGVGLALTGSLLLACQDSTAPAVDGDPPPGQIAFVAGTPGTAPSTTDLYLIGADGRGLAQLTTTPGVGERAPTWSRDGQRLGFSGLGGAWYDMNIDGADVRALPARLPGVRSPDGARLAYSRIVTYADGQRAATLFVANADGSGAAPVAAARPSPCASPCAVIDQIDWAPDGRRLVYQQRVAGTGGANTGDLYVADADGSTGAVQLTSELGLETEPRWSPDGQRIAFVLTCGCITGVASEVYVINVDGTASTPLTARSASGPRSYRYLSWSPDGRWLAVAQKGTGDDDAPALYALSVEVPGTPARRIAAPAGGVLETAWRPAATAP